MNPIMAILDSNLALERCPHCGVSKPLLQKVNEVNYTMTPHLNNRLWYIYSCTNCLCLVLAWSYMYHGPVQEVIPNVKEVDDALPVRAAAYLKQAYESIHAPSASIMVSASAVDSMLKDRGYTDGKLYSRIISAVNNHILTEEMGEWAHKVRLDANNERHADDREPLPTQHDAQMTLEFAEALAQFLYVLPARVRAGIERVDED